MLAFAAGVNEVGLGATVTPGRFVAAETENVVPAGSVPFRFALNGS